MRQSIVAAIMLATSALAAAAQETHPNYQSCAVDYADNFLAVEDFKLGVPVERMQDRLNGNQISKLIREQGGHTALISI